MTSPARSQIQAAMAQLIARRGDLMLDEGVAVRPAALPQTPVLDDDGNVTQAEDQQIYPDPASDEPGRCTIADPSSALQGNRTVNDQAGVPNQRILRLPADSPGLLPGDLFTVTASAVSPGLVGDTFVVAGEEERSYATYRRYVLRGSSWLSPEAGP